MVIDVNLGMCGIKGDYNVLKTKTVCSLLQILLSFFFNCCLLNVLLWNGLVVSVAYFSSLIVSCANTI